LIVSRKIAGLFKNLGFVSIDYLVENKLERNPSKILNILNRDWRKWVKPACMFDGGGLDPTFGKEVKGLTEAYEGSHTEITGSWFSCPEAGTATSITVYIKQYSTTTPKIKCAIYRLSDGVLIARTEEWTVTSGWNDWKTFNVIWGGTLTATDYILVFWPSGSAAYFYYDDDTNRGRYKAYEVYNNFPDPWSPFTDNHIFSIYCTYTAAAPPPKPKGTIAIHTKLAGII
jgi:hypothetical protein